ncbi:cysteine hydrolase family protein [Staphylococcus warneri]|uniref:cysteine hydrolase family protein n=1 Tax=Staphylococcus warneri TaxID=1292 RepID=UPI000952525F|nr:cysteine hydrolase family protein [Staphylococcus warneri]MBE9429347.1 cysteine hydrolase [Staphylococcus epidermidis]OLS09459.1 isochorismatase [Staphylococcus epidermidis]PTI20401.1 cysteine hydrolase [Staphylococcus warneri]PTI24951.1 cysteine hydrolase [Staphylococcus warneri]PTI60956.1 cysteine hydrolase [Staphylococcus warneri]
MTKKQALIIIDIQNDYFEGGKNPLVNPELATDNAVQLKDKFKHLERPVIYIQHIDHTEDAPLFEAGTDGIEIHEKFNLQSDDIVIEKQYPNSFLGTTLQDTLQEYGVEQLVITGMMTHMCIDSTTRAAAELGYEPILIEDTTATCNLEYKGQMAEAKDVQNAFISALSNFAVVTTTTVFLSNLK